MIGKRKACKADYENEHRGREKGLENVEANKDMRRSDVREKG